MFEDLREYIEWLQSSDKLHKVNKKVSSDCEITEIVTRMIEKNGPTLLFENVDDNNICLLYTSPSPRDRQKSRMPSSA